MVAKVKLPFAIDMSLPPFSFSTTVPVAPESAPPTVYVYIDVPPLPPYPLLPPQETTIPARRSDTPSLIGIFRTFIMNISFRSVGGAGHRGGCSRAGRRGADS